MKIVLVVIILIVALGVVGSFARSMNPFSMIVAIVAISVFGGVLREFAKDGGGKKAGKNDMAELNQRIAQIETDIADIKDQIADFIIKQY
jgi:hypothetical protein